MVEKGHFLQNSRYIAEFSLYGLATHAEFALLRRGFEPMNFGLNFSKIDD
jgi:hypothetical protein